MNEIRQAKISELTPDPNNANQGTERGGYMVRRSLEKLGAGRSVLIDKNGILIAGNKTTEAAAELGLEDAIIVPTDGTKLVVVQRTDLDLATDAKAKELAIADNRTGEIGLAWDNAVLEELAQDVILDDWFTPEEMAGWDIDLDDFEPPSDEEDEETTADLIEQAEEGGIESRVKLGEIWQLGRHRIACGDSTDEGNVQKLLGGKRFEMIFTDPPYGVDYEGGHFNPNREKLANDDKDIYSSVIPVMAANCDGPIYTWFAGSKALPIYQAVSKVGEIHTLIIWHKINAKYAAMNAQYKQRHEPCLYWKPKGKTLRWIGATTETTLWEMKRDAQNTYHPTQKPVELAERAMGNHDANLIGDFFLGSGSTLIAAQKMPGKRTVYGFELSPDYCEVIIRRWEEFSGGVAQLAGHL